LGDRVLWKNLAIAFFGEWLGDRVFGVGIRRSRFVVGDWVIVFFVGGWAISVFVGDWAIAFFCEWLADLVFE
jgi:hypothetical protein